MEEDRGAAVAPRAGSGEGRGVVTAPARVWNQARRALDVDAEPIGGEADERPRAWKQREQSFPPPPRAERRRAKGAAKRRRQRYEMRAVSRERSAHKNVQKCGRCRYLAGRVHIAVSAEGSAFLRGLVTCASVWECPVCALGIAHGRSEELRELVDRHRARGGAAYLATFTLPHDVGDELEEMRRHVSRAWQFVQSGAPWKRWRARLELVGSVRAMELTHGASGWHPHLHVLLLPGRVWTEGERAELLAWLLERWRRAIARPTKSGKRYRIPSDAHGVTLTDSHRSDYIAKLGLADELTAGAWTKTARGVNRTPFRILADLTDAIARREGKTATAKRDAALWDEYAREMWGARQLTFSKGLRERYAVAEQTDLELATAEEKRPADVLFTFESADWDTVLARKPRVLCRMLEAAESLPPPDAVDRIIRLLDRAKGLQPVPF